MIHEIDDYIDQLGGEWTLDYQYIRAAVKFFCLDIHTKHVYDQVAAEFGTSYGAVQKGVGRIAEELWESGKDILRRDLQRPGLTYAGPLRLAVWIARAVTKNRKDW